MQLGLTASLNDGGPLCQGRGRHEHGLGVSAQPRNDPVRKLTRGGLVPGPRSMMMQPWWW